MSAAQIARTKYSRYPKVNGLFSSVPESVIRDLERKFIFFGHSAGSVLFRQGEVAEGIFFLFEGRVRLSAIAMDSKTALLRIAEPGEVLGLAAVVSGMPHLTTAQTSTPASVALLREKDIIGGMERHPKLSEAVARCLARECKQTAIDMLLLRVPCASSQRLAAILLRLVEGHGSAQNRQPLTYTHAELGQLIGASRETVTRLMKKFERAAVIETKHSAFQVTDTRKLKEIARLS